MDCHHLNVNYLGEALAECELSSSGVLLPELVAARVGGVALLRGGAGNIEEDRAVGVQLARADEPWEQRPSVAREVLLHLAGDGVGAVEGGQLLGDHVWSEAARGAEQGLAFGDHVGHVVGGVGLDLSHGRWRRWRRLWGVEPRRNGMRLVVRSAAEPGAAGNRDCGEQEEGSKLRPPHLARVNPCQPAAQLLRSLLPPGPAAAEGERARGSNSCFAILIFSHFQKPQQPQWR